jgi:hypothetical protein
VNGFRNPLAAAAQEGLTEAIKCLLEAGADPNNADMVRLLSSLSHHANSERCLTCNNSRDTALQHWCITITQKLYSILPVKEKARSIMDLSVKEHRK